MTDFELLVLAAKAAGLSHTDYTDVGYDGRSGLMLTDEMGRQTVSWSPLTDDGDAFRLVVELNIQVHLYGETECVYAHSHYSLGVGTDGYHSYQGREYMKEPFDGDKLTATRRAIVRAAADIGREE